MKIWGYLLALKRRTVGQFILWWVNCWLLRLYVPSKVKAVMMATSVKSFAQIYWLMATIISWDLDVANAEVMEPESIASTSPPHFTQPLASSHNIISSVIVASPDVPHLMSSYLWIIYFFFVNIVVINCVGLQTRVTVQVCFSNATVSVLMTLINFSHVSAQYLFLCRSWLAESVFFVPDWTSFRRSLETHWNIIFRVVN